MRTELFTVSKIFTEALYRIPDYQRGYSWGLDQLKDFWLDLEQLHGDSNHYTGVLTLEDVPEEKWRGWEDDLWIIQSRRYTPYYIVDGQQRLTTVIILLQALIETCKTASLNYTPLDDIRRKYIFDTKKEDASRSYIFGYEKDNPSYEYLKKRIFLEESDVHLPDEVTIYTKNLFAAKEFFLSEVAKLSKTALEKLFTKVTQQLVFNVYEISDDIDVFVTFETMNNRGKPLSTLELLKNRLIFLSTKLKAPAGREGILRRKINDAWKSAYHYLGKNDERPLKDDRFLETHLNYYYASVLVKGGKTDEEVFEREARKFIVHTEDYGKFLLNTLFTPKRINGNKIPKTDLPDLTREFIDDFSSKLKISVEQYYKLSTPNHSDYSDQEKIYLERLTRLLGYSPSPFLIAVYRNEKADKRLQFTSKLEKLAFCQSLGTRNSMRRINNLSESQIFLKYCSNKISIDEVLTYIDNQQTEIFKEISLSDVLIDWIKTGHGYYGWRSIKYFMYEYELHLQSKVKSERIKLNWNDFLVERYDEDYETIEHIYPQRAKDQYWIDRFSKFTPTQKRLLRNSLGNLLPLCRPRNSSLGNASFPEKLGDDTKMTGYKYGCYSEIEVANSYKDWGAEEILARGLHLLTFLENRWGITIGDKATKIRALGLNFLNKP